MTQAEAASIAALIVSTISLVVSGNVAFRDRGRPRVRSRFVQHFFEGTGSFPSCTARALTNWRRSALCLHRVAASAPPKIRWK